MSATAQHILQAALELDPDEREHLAQELLASLPNADAAAEADDALRLEVIRRARDVREGRAVLLDGPSSLRAARDRLQGR